MFLWKSPIATCSRLQLSFPMIQTGKKLWLGILLFNIARKPPPSLTRNDSEFPPGWTNIMRIGRACELLAGWECRNLFPLLRGQTVTLNAVLKDDNKSEKPIRIDQKFNS